MREEGGRISGNQYGFVRGRSTVDAIMKVREMVKNKQDKGLEVIAVSMDIKNAFNTIEWAEIKREMSRRDFPGYIQRIIGSYLSDRKIVWVGKDGKKHSRRVKRGVPQGPCWVHYYGT